MKKLTLALALVGSCAFAAKNDKTNLPLVAQVPTNTVSNEDLQKQINELKEALDVMTQGQFKGVMANLPQIKAQMEQQRIQDSIAENTVYQIPVDGSPVEGLESAKVTITEFSDMQCPYCIKSAPRIKALYDKYPTQVRVIYKHFPLSFHDKAKGAHAAARAAEAQGKFFEFRYELAKQAVGNPAALDSANYVKIAGQLKLDVRKFQKDMAVSADDEARFTKDTDLGQKFGVNGTPSYFINGKRADLRTLEAEVDRLVK